MKIGIIGKSGSGKTTLFNSLTGQSLQTGGSARVTHLAAVKVPDPRLDKLQEVTGRKNKTKAEIVFSDVAGGFSRPNRQHGLDAELAGMMKPFEAFAMVVADFPEYAMGQEGDTNPLSDAREMESDLVLADLMVVEAKFERMKREVVSEIMKKALEKCRDALEEGKPLRLVEFNDSEEAIISGFTFLSKKPALIILNVGEDKIGEAAPDEFLAYAEERGVELISISAKIEMEIAQMDTADRAEFLEEIGLDEPALDRFVCASYAACSLMSFFTCGPGGPDEARAWTIKRDLTAFGAAGKIHSDIQRGFIRAEVIAWDDLVDLGGLDEAKAKGKIRLEGKEYVVKDGEIVHFRFNV